MEAQKISRYWLKHFPYDSTDGQKMLIHRISGFLVNPDKLLLFIIKGYAGTGKTSIISSLVSILPLFDFKSVLLAPTGKASKVFSKYSGRKAYTIHKKLYFLRTSSDGQIKLVLQENLFKNTIFIVDEASMIPDSSRPADGSLFASQRLLDDLIHHVYQGENCRLILMGDTAQLPPVGLDISPALDTMHLEKNYSLSADSFELTQVVRQAKHSGILKNATFIRNKVNKKDHSLPLFSSINSSDTFRITGNELEEQLNDAYSRFGAENTIVICRSNKRANIFNQEIRKRILYRENEISTTDLMMVVRNNYFWLDKDAKAGFIANGDIIEILRINHIEELYGFHFADVSIRLTDFPEEPEIDVKVMLDTIMYETPSLPMKEQRKLAENIMKDYQDIPTRRARMGKLQQNPYYQALQVKFAYALTCHKAQGGQWDVVFVDQGYLTESMIETEYLRWLYTAMTRATRKLFLVNFNDLFY
ncbi:MAG: AAA family ATPase [Bacteroidetes bacterium]|nr:AAA family ATPase [Bacteroidota bacterium]